jgi:hypothetical protein
MSSLEEDEIYAIKMVTKILSCFSILGLFCVFFLFWFFKGVRSFALELVVWLSVSSMIFNFQYYFPTTPGWCHAQAIINAAFDTSSMIWTTIIGYTAYLSINNYDYISKHKQKYRILFFSTANVLPLIVVSM